MDIVHSGNKKQRFSWIDWAKVICIYLMVCCHAGQKGLILYTTYQFHIPAFFIISGFLFRPKGIYKEITAFCIPILFYGIINLTYRLFINFYHVGFDFTNLSLNSTILDLIYDSEVSWFQGYWFVATLFIMRLIMELNLLRQHKYTIAIACFLYCCIEPYLNIPSYIMHFKPYHIISGLPFFVTGMGIKEKECKILQTSLTKILAACILFFALLLLQGRPDLGGLQYGKNYSIFFINAFLGSWVLFYICSKIPQNHVIEIFSIGTFLILGLHGLIYGYINSVFSHFFASYYIPMYTGIVILVLCYPLIKFLIHKQPILLGKIH